MVDLESKEYEQKMLRMQEEKKKKKMSRKSMDTLDSNAQSQRSCNPCVIF